MLAVSTDWQIYICFAFFGLLNNILYVVILSAAADVVGPATPTGAVLLANIVPCFLFKISGPFFLHKFPYRLRFVTLFFLSLSGNIFLAYGNTQLRIFGIILSSLAGGLGELTYLQMTAMFGTSSINGYSSGTGAAGLVGSFIYMVLTTWCQLAPQKVLALFCLVTIMPALTYVYGLPWSRATYIPLEYMNISEPLRKPGFKSTLSRIRPLVLRYILPLSLVYICEYTINQGISPTLLFDLNDMPFRSYRDAYVTYNTLYQIGVFISRSSAIWFRVYNLYVPTLLQALNVILCIWQSMYMILPNIYWLFGLMVYEGLLGGLAFVNTYMLVSEQVPLAEREFAMGVVGVSDSAGIVVAGLISVVLQPYLCKFQQNTGRQWCLM